MYKSSNTYLFYGALNVLQDFSATALACVSAKACISSYFLFWRFKPASCAPVLSSISACFLSFGAEIEDCLLVGIQ